MTASSQLDGIVRAPPKLSLRANFSWTLLGNLIYAACQWAMFVVVAKLTKPEEVGRFALGLAVTGPIFMFANLQLRSIQATDAPDRIRFSDYLSVRILATVAALVTVTIIAQSSGALRANIAVIIGVAIAKSTESISDVFYGLLQKHQRMDHIARSLIARGISSLLFLALGVRIGGSVGWGVSGMAFAWIVVLLLHDVPKGNLETRRPIDTRTKRRRWHDRLAIGVTGFPLGVVMLLVSLNVNLPRYFLQIEHGERYLGIFAALASGLTAGQLVINALAQSASPVLARLAANGDRRGFLTLLRKLLMIGGLLGIAGVMVAAWAGRPLIALVFTREYANHYNVLVIIMVAAAIGFCGSCLGCAMTALRAFKEQVPLFILVCGVTALWAHWDVRQSGLGGAARSLVASAIVQLAGSVYIVSRKLRSEACR